jgi:glycosylphosphatidylinositol deacylase
VHFDYFSIDYAEELSALSGGVLEQQAQFAAHCVHKILQLYAKKQPSAKATAQASLSDPNPSGSAFM